MSDDDQKFICGQVWQRQWPDCRRFLLIFVDHKKTEEGVFIPQFALLHVSDGHARDDRLNAVGFQHKMDGSYLYDPAELDEYFFPKAHPPEDPKDASHICPLRCDFVHKDNARKFGRKDKEEGNE